MIGTLDYQVIEKFKEFQEKTGKYVDLNIEDVEFKKISLSDSTFFEINPKKSEIDISLKNSNIDVSFVPLEKIDAQRGIMDSSVTRKIIEVYNGYTYFKEDDVIFTKVTPSMENGNFAIAKNLTNGIGFGSSEYHIFRCKNFLPELLWLLFRANYFRNKAKKTMRGAGGLKRVPIEFFDTEYIPVPKDYNEKYKSIDIQKAIVEFLEFWKINYTDIFRHIVSHQKPIIEKIKKVLISATLKYDKTMVNSFNEFASNKGFNLKLDEIKFENSTLGNAIDLIGGDRITKKNNSGTIYPVYGGGDVSFKTDTYNRENEYVVGRFAISETCVRFVNKKFHLLDSGFTFKIKDHLEEILDKNFIGYFLLSIQHKIYACAKGAGQKNLDIKLFNKIDFLFPKDKNIQALLVEFWEMILNNIDERFTKFDNIERLTDKIDEAFLYRTFSKTEWR